MKRLLYILLFIIGCSGDDNNNNHTPQNIKKPNIENPTEQIDYIAPNINTDKINLGIKPTNVITANPTSLGLNGVSVNGKIQPHTKPTQYYFEYGKTNKYGNKTNTKNLGPTLTGHYKETWDKSLSGWDGGFGGDLKYHIENNNGFVRFSEPSANDGNHLSGIGYVHLAQYFYNGIYYDLPTPALGGGNNDLRDAKITISVRGNDWKSNGSELGWWSQVDIYKNQEGYDAGAANWAFVGHYLTDLLKSGKWETEEYRLYNDTNLWNHAGSNGIYGWKPRELYKKYYPLNDVLEYSNIDVFHMLTNINIYQNPEGTIDFDNFEITYRNNSVLTENNGGKLISYPTDSKNIIALNDGWITGRDKSWVSSINPQGYQEFIYQLKNPIKLNKIIVRQNIEYPSKDIDVYCFDGEWKFIQSLILEKENILGANFTYSVSDTKELNLIINKIKIVIKSGYNNERWGLSEIEAYGDGAEFNTDDDWYCLTDDINDLEPDTNYHIRLVAVQNGKLEHGNDMIYKTPNNSLPEIITGSASRITNSTVKIDGRANTFGTDATFYFEYGFSTEYGNISEKNDRGTEITPSTIIANLSELQSGKIFHYRLVGENKFGKNYGEDKTFTTLK